MTATPSYLYVVDSYAWIEYFKGSASGQKARHFIEGGSAATSAITVAELSEKYLRERWSSFDQDLAFITSHTTIIPLELKIAVLAGQINHSQKKTRKDWGMADSIILATARLGASKVITGDPHFKGISDAILI